VTKKSAQERLAEEAPEYEAIRKAHDLLVGWDFSPIVQYLIEREGYALEEVADMQREYIRYIALAAGTTDPLPMSAAVDPFWHTHILFTMDYMAMCYAVKGEYIHHNPALTDKNHEELQGYVQGFHELYLEHFGDVSDLWSGSTCIGPGKPNCTMPEKPPKPRCRTAVL
jgi:hypothetical protein